MLKRIITGAIMLGILLPLIIINHYIAEIGFCAVAMFMVFVGAFEYTNAMYHEKASLKKFRIIIPIMSVILAFGCMASTYFLSEVKYQLYVLLAFVFFVIIILTLMIFTPDSDNHDIGNAICALAYTGLLFGYALSLRYFVPDKINNTFIHLNGRQSLMFVYTIVMITDTFAYLIGRKIGRHKIAPHISPNKSLEGCIAGSIAGMIVGCGLIYLFRIVRTTDYIFLVIGIGLVFSLAVSIATQIGDLIESKFKRSFGVKDFGKILPGHGGILDRFDSLIFAGALFYLLLNVIENVIL